MLVEPQFYWSLESAKHKTTIYEWVKRGVKFLGYNAKLIVNGHTDSVNEWLSLILWGLITVYKVYMYFYTFTVYTPVVGMLFSINTSGLEINSPHGLT